GRELRAPERRDDLVSAAQPLPRDRRPGMTTTDDFTEAARAEAWHRHPDPVDEETGEPVDDWGFEESARRDFLAGAKWARAHLAAQEPTAAEHRIARLEAQTDIRGRAVAICQRRAREAEAERDWNWRSSRHSKIERIRAIARADRAEAEARAQRRRADDMEDNALRAQTNLRAAEERADEWRHRIRSEEH